MAGNTLVGYYWRDVILREISTEAWEYLAVCVPIVVIGAPFGSVLGSHFHRQVRIHASTGATSIYPNMERCIISIYVNVHFFFDG